MNQSEMRDRFSARFQAACDVVARAPGRVNLIGEHTDYNEGFVLPIATEQDTWVAGVARRDGVARVFSSELGQEQTWPVDAWRAADLPHWTSYVAGVASLLAWRGAGPRGFDLLIRSSVPPGGGLSSSAALETATALALTHLAGERLEARELIDLCRRAEHDFAGVPCGLMDQSVSLSARPGTAFLLDCRTRDYQYIRCDLDRHVFVVIDSGVRRELAASEYARRQQECRQALEYFRRARPRVEALRDVSLETVSAHASQLDSLAAARARHVVSENERTLAAAEALRGGNLAEFGRLMSESHRSLRDDYAVSCRELDELVRIVSSVEGVLGARMTGGGFGGCIVALTLEDRVPRIEQVIRDEYDAGRAQPARLLRTRPSRGASIEFG
ncbi:MAG: galactokinase [Phycisphaerae bacterium]